jgi:HlyD family secretion protein
MMTNLSIFRTLIGPSRRRAGAASLGMLSIVGGVALMNPHSASNSGPTAAVRQGTLSETLVESGTVSSGRLLLYGSSISGVQAKILEIVPEGRTVAPGDVIIRFDSSTFQQNLAREEAALRQAEGELIRAKEDLRIERLRSEGDLAQAKQQIGYAQSELANQIDGKGRVAIAEVEAAEADAAREVRRTQTTYEDMVPMLERGFVTRAELERAEQAFRRAEEQLRLARLRREAMVGFERPAASARSRADVDAAEQTLTRQRETAKARLAGHEAAVRIASSRVEEIHARVALLHDQIARCDVRSDAAGMVVYRDLFFGNDKRKPQVGDEVWSNQPLLALPDANQLTIETRIREVDLHHVKAGTNVKVSLQAYPDLTLDGTIALIGALAEQDPTRAGTKFFPLVIRLQEADARLRTGMSAQVEIEVRRVEGALLVPSESVFEVAGRPTVFVAERGGTVARDVTITARNERDAALASGVAAGETVLLVDPRHAQ